MLRHQDSLQRNNTSPEAAFTLVEVLVALSILTTALVPAFVLAGDALKLSTRLRNTLISANLAQEGVEIARAIRDGNWFNGVPFDQGLSSCDAGCTVQFDSDAPVVGTFMNTPLKLDSATGLYQYSTGANSIFTRTITVTAAPPSAIKVVSEVSWMERSVPKKTTLEYYLFDWVQ